MPAIVQRLGMGKTGAIRLALINLLVWVPLIFAFMLLHFGITPVWLALLWFINLTPALLLSVHRDNWLSSMVPAGRLGRYLGQRLAIRSAFYLVSFYLLGYLLDMFEGDFQLGFIIVLGIGFLASFIDFIIFTFMHEPQENPSPARQTTEDTSSYGLGEFLADLREKKLDTFIIFTSLFHLTVGLSAPFYAVYMLQELKFSYLTFTIILSAEQLARIISVPFWGRLTDRVGNIHVLGIVARIIPVLPIAWLFSPNVYYLIFIQTVSGACWGAFDLTTQTYLLKVAPQAKKLHYIAYTRFLVLFCSAAGAFSGAYLVDGIPPVFGNSILSVFLVSGILRAMIVMFTVPRLVDLAFSFPKPPPPPEVTPEMLTRVITSKRGLFYRRPAMIPATEQAALPPSDLQARLVLSPEQKYATRRWVVDMAPAEEKEETPVIPVQSRRLWQVKVAPRGTATVPESMMESLPARRHGIYHDRKRWMEYLRETWEAALKERKTSFAFQPSRNPWW